MVDKHMCYPLIEVIHFSGYCARVKGLMEAKQLNMAADYWGISVCLSVCLSTGLVDVLVGHQARLIVIDYYNLPVLSRHLQ